LHARLEECEDAEHLRRVARDLEGRGAPAIMAMGDERRERGLEVLVERRRRS